MVAQLVSNRPLAVVGLAVAAQLWARPLAARLAVAQVKAHSLVHDTQNSLKLH